MISVPFGSGSQDTITPPALNDGSAEALSAWADYEYIMTLRNLAAAGIEIVKNEDSDFADLINSIPSTMQGLNDWYEQFLVDKGVQFLDNLISLAPLISTLASGGGDGVMAVLMGFVVNLLLTSDQRKQKIERQRTDDTNQEIQGLGGASEGFPDVLHISINNDLTQTLDERWQVVDEP